MALLAEEDDTCGGCGQPRDESMDPANEDAYRARLLTCHACAERQKTDRDLQDGDAEPGVHVVVTRRRPS